MGEHAGLDRRMFLWRAGVCLCAGLMPRAAYSQRALTLSGVACGLDRDVRLGDVTAFASSLEARQVVAEICDSVGLPANFEIVAVRDPQVNAYATVRDGRRYVVYDEQFMRSITNQRAKNWPGLAVMAHEVGHHLCGHTLDNVGSRPPRELEADSFAGFVVGTLGGTVGEATQIFQGTSDTGSATHPPRRERVAAATAGWQRASRKKQPGAEQFNVISHAQRPDGSYARVISEFVKQGTEWVEYQEGRRLAVFVEGVRDAGAIYLFDASRTLWVRITTNVGARVSVGSWSTGRRTEVPGRWTPLDPVLWR